MIRISTQSSLRSRFLTGILLLLASQVCGQTFIDQSEELGVVGIINSQEFGSGLSTYDYNQDGLDDISLCNSTGVLLFYRNTGNGFVLENHQIIAAGQSKSVIWVDYDNDSLLDIFVTTFQGPNLLYRNTGNFNFEVVTEQAGLPTTDDFNAGASFGDYDRDGFLDLYICKYANNYLNPPVSSVHYNKLYHNNGDGTFTDVTEESGVQLIPSLSLQSTWLDVNNDSWPDLYVINDRVPGNFLLINNTDGTFTDATILYDASYPNNCIMSNSVGDFDQDGDLDIFMTNSGNINTPNRLAVNQNTHFEDLAEEYDILMYEFAWGATWIDADNDSWEDLYIVLPGTDANHLYLNNQGQSFIDSPNEISVEEEYTCYAPAKGDFNNDGYADVAIQSISPNPPYVMMNSGGTKHFIKLTLTGTQSNKQAIGSWINLHFSGKKTSHFTLCGENYHGQNSQHMLFGVGGADLVDSVSIKYASGHTDWYYDLQIDTSYYFTEGETYKAEIFSEQGNELCIGDSLILSAGQHPEYLWNNGDTTQQTTIDTAGLYTVTVTNEFNITAVDSVLITQNPTPQISNIITPNLCFGDSTGSILLVNQTGIAMDSIQWSNGSSNNPIVNIPAGEYTYLYADINGCSISGTANIISPPDIEFLVTTIPETENQNNGSISISAFGGTPPFEIFLDGQQVQSPITDLQSGNYLFTVFDGNDCQDEFSVFVDQVLNVDLNRKYTRIVYPNPFKNKLQIQSDIQPATLQLQSVDGRLISNQFVRDGSTYDLSNVRDGMYILKVVLPDGNYIIERITKTSH